MHISQGLWLTHVDNVRGVEEVPQRQRKLQRCLGHCPIGQWACLLRKSLFPIGKAVRPTTQTRAAHTVGGKGKQRGARVACDKTKKDVGCS